MNTGPAIGYQSITAREGIIMGLKDKIGNAAENAKGKAKETTGKATDDETLEAEGRGDQTKSDVKKAAENIKDAFKH